MLSLLHLLHGLGVDIDNSRRLSEGLGQQIGNHGGGHQTRETIHSSVIQIRSRIDGTGRSDSHQLANRESLGVQEVDSTLGGCIESSLE